VHPCTGSAGPASGDLAVDSVSPGATEQVGRPSRLWSTVSIRAVYVRRSTRR
jgi:hypothetical protein